MSPQPTTAPCIGQGQLNVPASLRRISQSSDDLFCDSNRARSGSLHLNSKSQEKKRRGDNKSIKRVGSLQQLHDFYTHHVLEPVSNWHPHFYAKAAGIGSSLSVGLAGFHRKLTLPQCGGLFVGSCCAGAAVYYYLIRKFNANTQISRPDYLKHLKNHYAELDHTQSTNEEDSDEEPTSSDSTPPETPEKLRYNLNSRSYTAPRGLRLPSSPPDHQPGSQSG